MKDDFVLPQSALPLSISFDTFYYFKMDNETDNSPPREKIPTNKIIEVKIKDMTHSKDSGSTFIVGN